MRKFDVSDYGPVPDSSDPEVALMLRQLDQARAEWLEQLGDDVTGDELLWQAFPSGHSIAAILVHIAEVEAYWLHHVALGEPYRDIEAEALGGESIDQGAFLWPTAPRQPLSFYKELLTSVRERTRTLLAPLSIEHSAISDGRRGRCEFTLRWLLTHTLVHDAYHGGQATRLLYQQRRREP